MDRPAVKAGTLRGWHDKYSGTDVDSFLETIEAQAKRSQSLIWYVDPYSRVPLRFQLAWLWIKRAFGVAL